ncbi:MAG: 50S ribosomal protein L11 methyltransferase, partial [Synergistaceae bacterium]|nr:50S ribosomal protein L11 methyltransferase [Synergistaceae bacterium]
LLTANILLEPLTTMVGQVPKVIGREGMAIFSGMLLTERDIFVEALEKAKMVIVKEHTKGDWWGVAAKAAS